MAFQLSTHRVQARSLAQTRHFPSLMAAGDATGILGKDVVQMAGFEVSNQVFGMSFITYSLDDSLMGFFKVR
jgi:ABC-type transporter Mla maintaining outer membrane lipid asymmetry permease subunit MlaE